MKLRRQPSGYLVCLLQRLEQQGELVQQHTDCFTHVLAQQQRGVTKASIAAVVAAGKIPLLLTDVEGVQRAQANHLDCFTVFVAPASLQVHTMQMPKQHYSCSCILFRHQFNTFTSSTQAQY